MNTMYEVIFFNLIIFRSEHRSLCSAFINTCNLELELVTVHYK